MKSLKTILIIIFIQYLSGCASSSSTRMCKTFDPADTNDPTLLKKIIIKEKISENVITESKIPNSQFSKIESAEIKNTVLKIKFTDRDYIERYSSPQIKLSEKTELESNRAIGLLVGTILSPIMIFSYERWLDATFNLWIMSCL